MLICGLGIFSQKVPHTQQKFSKKFEMKKSFKLNFRGNKVCEFYKSAEINNKSTLCNSGKVTFLMVPTQVNIAVQVGWPAGEGGEECMKIGRVGPDRVGQVKD